MEIELRQSSCGFFFLSFESPKLNVEKTFCNNSTIYANTKHHRLEQQSQSHWITSDPLGFPHYNHAAVTFGWTKVTEFGVSNKEAWIHFDFMSLLVVW